MKRFQWICLLLATLSTPALAQELGLDETEQLPMCLREQVGFYIDPPGMSNKFQPAGIHYKDEGIERTVVIPAIRFVDADDLLRREPIAGKPDEHKLILRDDRTARWRVANDGESLHLTFETPDKAGQLRVTIEGATRAVSASGSAARIIREFADPAGVTSPAALQNGRDQQGLTLWWRLDGKASEAKLTQGKYALELSLDYKPGQTITLDIASFAGDALIALEDLPAPERQARPQPALVATVDMRQGPGDSGEISGPEDLSALAASEDGGTGQAPTGGGWWDLFPKKTRVMAPLLADPRETTMRFGYMADKEGETYFDVQFGGDLVLWWWPIDDKHEMTFSVRGLATTRFLVDDNFPQLNTDYFGGVALGYRYDKDTFEVYLYHESSHLGDETLDFGRRDRIDYAREAIRVLWSREILPDLRVYFGPTFNFSGADPKDIAHKWILQGGAEYQFRLAELPMYAAVDLKAKQESDWRVNTAVQLGMFLLEPDDESVINRPRVFFEFFNGNSEMGQYYDEHESTFLIGVGFDL